MSGDDAESKKQVIYLATNMLSPLNQRINDISVDTVNEDQIYDHLKK